MGEHGAESTANDDDFSTTRTMRTALFSIEILTHCVTMSHVCDRQMAR